LSFQNIKGVLDLRVTMPRHFLRRGNREFGDPESRTHKVMRQTLHFVKAICSASWAIQRHSPQVTSEDALSLALSASIASSLSTRGVTLIFAFLLRLAEYLSSPAALHEHRENQAAARVKVA